MFFDDWETQIKDIPQVSRHLLWEVDYDAIDWWKMRKLVVQRVLERGNRDDFYAIFSLYGGVEGVKSIIKEIPACFDPKDEAFILTIFDLKKEDLQCYTRKQLRNLHLIS